MKDIEKRRALLGSPKDNEEYVDFINYVFGFNGNDRSFYKLLPKLFGEGRDAASVTYFVKDERGKMLSAVGAFPLDMVICGEQVRARGIGNVAVHPRHRGKGYMIDAMGAALDAMTEEGVCLSILSGKRTRYDHFGFEKCGTESVYAVSPKNLADRAPGYASRLTVKRLERDEDKYLDLIYELHNSFRDYRFVRERERLYDILVSWQATPLVFLEGDTFVGWALVKDRSVTELVYTDKKYVKDMIYALGGRYGYLEYIVPLCDERKLGDLIFDYAETVYTGADLCFNVLDYQRMLYLLMKLKCGYEPLADGSLTVEIKGYARTERLRIGVKEGVPEVAPTDDPPELTLEHIEAMQTFFMQKAPARAKLSPVCRSWFPLPIYVYSADNV